MKAVLLFLVIALGESLAQIAGKCFMSTFYLELGCAPVSSDGETEECPTAYNCPDLHPDPSMCYYRGKAYSNRVLIPESDIQAACSQACSCTVRGGPVIECASVDCAESFDSDIKQQCIDKYELDACCSTGMVCGKDAIAQLATCEVDGKIYYEGQQMEPKSSRKTCICGPGWDGSLNNTFCKDINCGIELHHQDDLMKNCAPVFYGNGLCPIDFQCPSATTSIIHALNIRANANRDKYRCVFGNDTLRIGDEIRVDDKCSVCKCEVPPFVACKQKNGC